MPQTPDQEVPGDAVPQPDEAHCCNLPNKNNGCYRKAAAAQPARQWVEIIGPEPLRQCHVPAVPKGRQVSFEVGGIEVFGQLNAKQFGNADGDVRIARKVEEDAQAVAVKQHPHPSSRLCLQDVV